MADHFTGKQADVIVLGAGIVGVSAAYAARQRGLSVILIDRREPGSETSYGNAGILQRLDIAAQQSLALGALPLTSPIGIGVALIRHRRPQYRLVSASSPWRRRGAPRPALHADGASLKPHRE